MSRTKKHDILGKVEYTPVFQFLISDPDVLASVNKRKIMPVIIALVLGRMWRHAWGDKGLCTASQVNMAEELGLSISTVQRAIQILEEVGLVTDLDKGKRTFYNGKGIPHRHAVNIESILAKHFTWRRKNGLPEEEMPTEEVPAQEETPAVTRPNDNEVKFVNVRELKRSLREE